MLCAKQFEILDHLKQHAKDTTHNVRHIIEQYEQQGYSIDKMIEIENQRKLPNNVKRNVILSYLVKKKVNFRCQKCKSINDPDVTNCKVCKHELH